MRFLNRVARPLAATLLAGVVLVLLVAGLFRGGVPRPGSARSAAAVPPAETMAKAQQGVADSVASGPARAANQSASQSMVTNASGAAAGAAPAAPGQLGPLPALDRMIVKTGAMTLQLPEASQGADALAAAMQRVNGVLAGIPGAYVASSSTSYRAQPPDMPEPAIARPEPAPLPKPHPAPAGLTATLTLQVPVDAFDQTMARLRELGSPLLEQVRTQEVTEEYVDLEAQVRTLEATEQQYLRFMERAQRLEEILPIQQRLIEVRTQVERLRGRMTLLQRRSDVSTITLTLVVPGGKGSGVPGEPRALRTLRDAWSHLAVVLQGLLDVAIYVAIYTLPLAPLAMAYVWWRRRQPRPTAAGGAV